jgi:hypothetical protein
MSVISPEEMRYSSISAFGLIIFTAILKWSGVGATRFTPAKLDTTETENLGNKSVIETLFDPDFTNSTPFNALIDAVLTPLQFAIDLLLTWASVWDTLGFGSVFIIVPMFLMTVIVASAALSLVEAILP